MSTKGSELMEKTKHQKRIEQKLRHIQRQIDIRSSHGVSTDTSYHKYHKVSGLTCGSSTCRECGNPRKFFNEPTIQERRFFQTVDFQNY